VPQLHLQPVPDLDIVEGAWMCTVFETAFVSLCPSTMASPYPPPKDSPGGAARIGRPPQWTSSRSRKLARLYMYTNLTVDKILKVLEDDVFKPR
jgi:hypothetical protein